MFNASAGIPSMVVVGPDGQVKLSTVLTYKVDKYLKELTTGAWTPKNNGERITIDGDHGKLVAYLQKPELSEGQTCPMVIQEYFDHGFSQNIYRTTDIVSRFLIKQLKK